MSQAALAHPAAAARSFDLTIQQALLELDRIAVRRGVRLSIETDPTEFGAVSLANEKTQARLMPVLDFRLHEFDSSNFIWLKGEDCDGRVVTTAAIRLLDMQGMNLKQFGESLRLFYGDPLTQCPPGESYVVNCPSGPKIKGRVTFSGGIWIDPRFRGAGADGFRLSQVLGRFVRLLGCADWDPDFYISGIRDVLHAKGMGDVYGWPRVETGIQWIRPSLSPNTPPYQMAVRHEWMTRGELIHDARLVAEGKLLPIPAPTHSPHHGVAAE
ncbi:MAG: hypothetical protein HYR63_04885 [Proteobacteria bacterium]|nr:hypothetical protein [Pseudomonadota bacterium]MBI3496627.1 hypothetical protein [Pseudomonadota bacterium]